MYNFKRIIKPITNDYSNTKYHKPLLTLYVAANTLGLNFRRVRKIAQKATICIVMSVHLFAWNNLALNGWLLMKVDV
jgi:hypothetical protein